MYRILGMYIYYSTNISLVYSKPLFKWGHRDNMKKNEEKKKSFPSCG